jgi:hypothetical protein
VPANRKEAWREQSGLHLLSPPEPLPCFKLGGAPPVLGCSGHDHSLGLFAPTKSWGVCCTAQKVRVRISWGGANRWEILLPRSKKCACIAR